MPKKRYTIGVDPGLHTGFAVYDRNERRLCVVETHDFWSAYDEVLAAYPPDTCDIIVEDASQNTVVFWGQARRQGMTGAAAAKLARNVGYVQRESQLLIEGLRRRGYAVRAVRPTSAKVGALSFQRYTGWSGRTNQHERDAGMLAFGVHAVPATALAA